MLTAHELFGFMSPDLAQRIIQAVHDTDRDLYRATMAAVAEARKVRPIFLERKARIDRDKDIIAALGKPRLEMIAANLIRGWLVKHRQSMLVEFLDTLGVPHKDGSVDDLPPQMDDARLEAAIARLLEKYPREEVAVYLHAFYSMNEANWANLKAMLETDVRLQLGA